MFCCRSHVSSGIVRFSRGSNTENNGREHLLTEHVAVRNVANVTDTCIEDTINFVGLIFNHKLVFYIFLDW